MTEGRCHTLAVDSRGIDASERTRREIDLSHAWDNIAHRMEVYPEYYEFVAEGAAIVGLPLSSAIVDVGCGTGRLLSVMQRRGYNNLTGIDFSRRATELTKQRVPGCRTLVHDIVEAPLAEKYDAAFLTEVIEHLTDPVRALHNLHLSLRPGGFLFLSFPNRSAYWPIYHLRFVRKLARDRPRLRHWLEWFTMPYEMRSDQPLDHSYDRKQVAYFITASGFEVLQERGMRILPMLRIPGLPHAERLASWLERIAQRTSVKGWYYRYMLVCQKRGPGLET